MIGCRSARRFVWRFAGVVAAGVVAFPEPAPGAQAGRIGGISPSCAAAGEQVMLTGIGLGARNLQIAVGGVRVGVASATGSRATFVVPAVAPGSTSVVAANPGGHMGSIAFRVKGPEVCGNAVDDDCDGEADEADACTSREVVLPQSWSGEWEITVSYQSAATESVVAIDQITAVLCSGEPFGLALLDSVATCTGQVSDTSVEIACSSELVEDGCVFRGILRLSGERAEDTLLASGEWSAAAAGDCAPLANAGERIEVAGMRLDAAAACEQPSSLARKLVTHPSVIGLIGD